MHGDRWTNFQELRQPGIQRVLDAMKAIENERPGLFGEAVLAFSEFAKKNVPPKDGSWNEPTENGLRPDDHPRRTKRRR